MINNVKYILDIRPIDGLSCHFTGEATQGNLNDNGDVM